MLNKYLWELYKRSGGYEVIELFRTNLNGILSDEYIKRIKELHGYYCADKGIVEACNKQLHSLRNIMLDSPPEECQDDADLYIDGETDIQNCFKEVYNEWIETEKTDKSVLDMFSWNIAPISTELAFDYPGLFVPYYFYCNYNILTAISDTFDITLPVVPRKADHYARTWHYAELCDALNKFRIPLSWHKTIVRENGKPYLLAITLLADIVYWYRPVEVRDEATGNIIGWRKRFRSDYLQKTYEQYSEFYGESKRSIKAALDRLEEIGVIKKILRHVSLSNGTRIPNVMYIALNADKLREITFLREDRDAAFGPVVQKLMEEELDNACERNSKSS